ncbi:MAG: hypothetical protein DRI57_20670 [Deltaproteobacteria bacterium]|nr:MAG: hypothetical protein DRI57_20670 [Deltaproteobacteria bacterium]
MSELEYLTDRNGLTKTVVVPIELWNRLFLKNDGKLSEAMEDYCLNKAMDEAKESPLLSRDEALSWLESLPSDLSNAY